MTSIVLPIQVKHHHHHLKIPVPVPVPIKPPPSYHGDYYPAGPPLDHPPPPSGSYDSPEVPLRHNIIFVRLFLRRYTIQTDPTPTHLSVIDFDDRFRLWAAVTITTVTVWIWTTSCRTTRTSWPVGVWAITGKARHSTTPPSTSTRHRPRSTNRSSTAATAVEVLNHRRTLRSTSREWTATP